MTRYAARVDDNHAIIRECIRRAGYQAYDTFRLGQGFPDLLVVSKSGIIGLLEVKSENGNLNANEREFWSAFRGPKMIVRSPEDALAFLAWLDEITMECR